MKNKHQIDEIFKKALSGYEEEHPDHLWSGIERRINIKDKPNPMGPYLLWSSLALALLITGGVMYWYVNGQSSATKTGINNQTALLQEKLMETDARDMALNTTRETQTGVQNDANITVEQKVQKNLISENPLTKGDVSVKQQINVNKQTIKLASTNNTVSQDEVNRNGKNQSNAKGWSQTDKTTSNEALNSKEGTKTIFKDGLVESQNDLDKGPLDNNKGFTNTIKAQKGLSLSTTRHLLDPLSALEPHDLSSIGSIWDDKSKSLIRKRQVNTNLFSGKNRIPVIWSVAMVVSPDVISRELSYDENIDEAYFLHRNEKETFVNAFTTGLRLEARMQAWTLTTGIHYNQINERYTYMDDEASKSVGGVMKTGRLEKSKVNRYRFIEVPVMLGYRLRSGAFYMELKGGVAVSASAFHEGEIFNDETRSNEGFKRGGGFNPFKEQVPLAVLGAVSVGYKVGRSLDLFVEPYYKFYTGSITNDNNSLQQTYKLSGLSFGARQMLR